MKIWTALGEVYCQNVRNATARSQLMFVAEQVEMRANYEKSLGKTAEQTKLKSPAPLKEPLSRELRFVTSAARTK